MAVNAPRWRTENELYAQTAADGRPVLRRSQSDESSETSTIVDGELDCSSRAEPCKTGRAALSYHQSIKTAAESEQGSAPADWFVALRSKFQSQSHGVPPTQRQVGGGVHLRSASEMSCSSEQDDASQLTNVSQATAASRTSGYNTGTASLQNSLLDLYSPSRSELSLESPNGQESAGKQFRSADLRNLMAARRKDFETRRLQQQTTGNPQVAAGGALVRSAAVRPGSRTSTAVQRVNNGELSSSAFLQSADDCQSALHHADALNVGLPNAALHSCSAANGAMPSMTTSVPISSNNNAAPARMPTTGAGAADWSTSLINNNSESVRMQVHAQQHSNVRRSADGSIGALPGNQPRRSNNAQFAPTTAIVQQHMQRPDTGLHRQHQHQQQQPFPQHFNAHATANTSASILRTGSMIALPRQYDLTSSVSHITPQQQSRGFPRNAHNATNYLQNNVANNTDIYTYSQPVAVRSSLDHLAANTNRQFDAPTSNNRYAEELRRQSSIVLTQNGLLQHRASAHTIRQRSAANNYRRTAPPLGPGVNDGRVAPVQRASLNLNSSVREANNAQFIGSRGRSFTVSTAEYPQVANPQDAVHRREADRQRDSEIRQAQLNPNARSADFESVQRDWTQLKLAATHHSANQTNHGNLNRVQHGAPMRVPNEHADHMVPQSQPRCASPTSSNSSESNFSGNSVVHNANDQLNASVVPLSSSFSVRPEIDRSFSTPEERPKLEYAAGVVTVRSPARQQSHESVKAVALVAKKPKPEEITLTSVSDDEDTHFPSPPPTQVHQPALVITAPLNEPHKQQLSLTVPTGGPQEALLSPVVAGDFEMPPPLVATALQSAQRDKCPEELEYEMAALNFVQLVDNPYLKNVLVAENQPEFMKATDYLDDLFGVAHESRAKTATLARDSRDSSGRSLSKQGALLTDHQMHLFNRFGSIRRKQEQLKKNTDSSPQHDLPPSETMPRTPTRLPLNSAYWLSSIQKQRSSLNEQAEEDGDSERNRAQLIECIKKKRSALEACDQELQNDAKENERLGRHLRQLITQQCSGNEVDKFDRYLNELDNVIKLLLSLTNRLARAHNALLSLPDGEKVNERQRLEQKRQTLQMQYEDAKEVKERVDLLAHKTAQILRNKLSQEQFDEYRMFTEMKAKLIFEQQEISDSIKLADEQLNALQMLSNKSNPVSRSSLASDSTSDLLNDSHNGIAQPSGQLQASHASTTSATRLTPCITTTFVKQM